jgi:23S rRNA pseudouridine955/2504/2580 synthase
VNHIIGGISATHPPEAKTVLVDEDSSGQRLDNFLLRELKGVPKTHVYRIIRSGEVRLNKGRASADSRLVVGDLVRLPPLRVSQRQAQKSQLMTQSAARAAPARDFPILFEDEYLLAIDKPAGVAVHGGSGVSFGVIEQLRMARPQAKFLELVHRLDRDTSGLLLVAKKRSALTHLQDQFRERQTSKIYLALVAGCWPVNKKVLDKSLHKYLLEGRDGEAGERRVKVVSRDDPNGKPALTLVKVVQRVVHPVPLSQSPSEGFTLLEVTLKTGRTHQIRVHLASEGFPIAGDDKYGDFELNKALLRPTNGPALKRMFLHAWRLQVNHPVSGEKLELLAPLPSELEMFSNYVADSAS